jgi:membrane protein
MKEKLLNFWSFLKDLFAEWSADNCFQLAAALSYYTLFSLAPMLIIVISVAGYFFGEDAINGEIQNQLSGLIGPESAAAVGNMIQSAYIDNGSLIPTLIGLGTLFISATLAFTALQDSLNKIWKVTLKPQSGIIAVVINRVLSFAMVIGIGFLLLVSMVVHAVLNKLSDYIDKILANYSIYLINAIEFAISFSVITLLFAMIFKFLPDVKIKWKNVWLGAVITTILFSVGKYLISWQISNSDLGNTYGAAASIVTIMLWINYSSLILFMGAEFIYVYVRRKGEDITPNSHAEKIRYGRSEKEIGKGDKKAPAYKFNNGTAVVIEKNGR